MKNIGIFLITVFLSPALSAGDKDVWYNAKGEVVRVTPAEKEKEVFVPLWEKRELEREAHRETRHVRYDRPRRSLGNRYYYAYPNYGYYGNGYHYPYRSGSAYRGHYYPRWRFSGSYQGSNWSVRFRF